MASVAVEVDRWAERRRRTAELRDRRPFARELLDFYAVLLSVQQDAFRDAVTTRPPPDRLDAYVAELVMPSIVDVTMAVGPDTLRAAAGARFDEGDLRAIVKAWLLGESLPPVDTFLARASTSPVLEALDDRAAAAFAGGRSERTCPRCGGPPQLSYFAPAGEDLATGPRRLVCARCHASWGYARMTCAACGEDSSARLTIFSEEGTASGERGSVVRGLPTGAKPDAPTAVFPHVRVEACETCKRYLLNIDLAADASAVPLVDEMTAIPLDLYARERGFSKITPNLMGF
jgi:formate dehydrogenase maturation protein FdhE